MGVVRTGETEYDKELAKWEKPYRFEMFPKMVYKAVKKPNGKVVCMEPPPPRLGFATDAEYLAAEAAALALQGQCARIVRSEDEYLKAKGQGWCENASEALAQFEREEQAIGDAAAEVAFAAQRMSGKAQAELAAADAATSAHVVDVLRPPTKRSHHKRREPPPVPAAE